MFHVGRAANVAVLLALAAAPTRAQILVAPSNVSSSVGTAGGTIAVPVGPIANGQSYSLGGLIASGSDAARLAFGLQSIAPATVRYSVSAASSAGGHFDQGCYCVIPHSAGAGGITRLAVSAPQPMVAQLRIGHTVSVSSPYLYSTVDIDADSVIEFTAFGGLPAVQSLFVTIGPTPRVVEVRVSANSLLGFMVAGCDLQLDWSPAFAVTSGHGEVVPSGEPFPQPLAFRITDAAGAPVAGAPVAFSVIGPATLSAFATTTNANGIASVTATAQPAGGLVTVTASTPSVSLPAQASMFVRHLGAARTPGTVDIAVTNAPPSAPSPVLQVPMVLAVAPAGIAPLQTILGPICTNPFDPATIVIEDSLGIFGFVSLSGAGATGTPDLTRSYPLAPGVLAGVVLWVQGVGLDPDRGLFRTNCQQIVL